jgi:hypothetical protein
MSGETLIFLIGIFSLLLLLSVLVMLMRKRIAILENDFRILWEFIIKNENRSLH